MFQSFCRLNRPVWPARVWSLLKKMGLLFIALLLLPSIAAADDLDRFIEESMKQYQVPGCAVVLVHKGQVVKLKGYGERKKGGAPVDPDTIFLMASVTKALTATMLGTLVSDGKLDLDEPAVTYLPEMRLEQPFPTAQVTTRDFLCHRAGFAPFTGDLLGQLGLSRAEIVRRVRYLPLSQGFREKAGYNNVGIFLAGMVGERAGGASYEELMRRRLFGPLGMTRSDFLSGPFPPGANMASAHFPNGKVFDNFEETGKLAPAGAVTSTARDLSQWMLMLLAHGQHGGKSLLKPEVVAAMFRPTMVEHPGVAETPPIDANSGFSYGLVWGIFSYNGYTVAEKGGALAGTRTVVVLVPEKELGVAVLCNMNGTLLPELIRAKVLTDYLGPGRYDFIKAVGETQQKVAAFFAAATARPTVDLSIKPLRPLATYTGEYSQPLYGPLHIRQTPQGLTWQFGSDFWGPLYPAGYNSFTMSYPDTTNRIPEVVHFVIDEKGQALELVTESYGRFSKVARP